MWTDEDISMLLDLYPLDDLFDVLDIEPQRVLEILLEGGHVVLPPFMHKDLDMGIEDDGEST